MWPDAADVRGRPFAGLWDRQQPVGRDALSYLDSAFGTVRPKEQIDRVVLRAHPEPMGAPACL
jgi:hypothetical protein